jgi:hypothetical protein
MSMPSNRASPSTRTPRMRSFIRLSVRNSVDLPHPDGPMNAVMVLAGIERATFLSAWNSP